MQLEAFWKVLQAPPAEPLHLNMCSSSFPPAHEHTRCSLKCFSQAAVCLQMLLGICFCQIRGLFPQVHEAVMKTQINHKYFILSSVLLCSHPLYEKALSLIFIAVSSLKTYQNPAHYCGCHHAVPAHPAIPHSSSFIL